jgi:uncharacterized membrane protein
VALSIALAIVGVSQAAPWHSTGTTNPCTGSALPTLGGRNGNAVAVNRDGAVVGIADDATAQSRPVMWRAGGVTPLAVPLQAAVPTAVNRHGVVVGTGYDPGAEMLVGWWWDGTTHRLPVRAGDSALPEAIDDAGRVAGALVAEHDHADGPNADDSERAAYWPSVHTLPRQLPALPGDDAAHAFAIAPDGTVGGVSLGAGGTPVLWDRLGRLRSLGGPGGVHGFDARSRPVGQLAVPGGTHAVVWDAAGQPAELGRTGISSATDAAAASVVGFAQPRGGRSQAVIWLDGAARELPAVSTRGFTGVAGTANAVADTTGAITVAGFSADSVGVRRPTVWRCST